MLRTPCLPVLRLWAPAALALLCWLPAVPVQGQTSTPAPGLRALELEDYYRIQDIDSPSISPDGRWVTYTVSLPIEDTNGSRMESWVVQANGSSSPRQVTHDGGSVANPHWGEDGHLHYSAGEATWRVDPGNPTGAPERVEAPNPPGLRSPDGRWIARTERMERSAPPAPSMTPFQRRHAERFEGSDFDWYPFRRDGQAFPLPNPAEEAPSEIVLESADGSVPPRTLTDLGLQPGNLRWSPDGAMLLFTANEGELDELEYGSTDLYTVTPEGELTRLTDDGYSYASVDFSPDGRWISYVRSFGTDLIIELGLDHGGSRDLYLRPVGGGEAVNLTATWDLDPGTPQWSPDGRDLYFTAGIGGGVHLFRVAATGGGVEQVTTGPRRLGSVTFDASMRRMAYTVGQFDRPSDLFVSDIDGRGEVRLTDLHDDFLAEVEVASRPAETIHWTSYDGTEIEGFLLYPHGYDPSARYPLIVMNHGGPHAASGYGFSFKNALFAANGYFVFLPNFRSSTGYGDDFKWATWGGWGTLDGEDVLSGVDHLVAQYPIDGDRVGTTGHSYGGILTNWLITRYPERFRAAAPGAGESNWTSNFALSDVSRTKETEFFGRPWDPRTREIMVAQSPALNCGGVQAATLFVHGEVDYRVPLEGSIQLYTCLKKQRVPTRLIIYEGQSHGIRGHWNQVHRMMSELGWWETHLKPIRDVSDGS